MRSLGLFLSLFLSVRIGSLRSRLIRSKFVFDCIIVLCCFDMMVRAPGLEPGRSKAQDLLILVGVVGLEPTCQRQNFLRVPRIPDSAIPPFERIPFEL